MLPVLSLAVKLTPLFGLGEARAALLASLGVQADPVGFVRFTEQAARTTVLRSFAFVMHRSPSLPASPAWS